MAFKAHPDAWTRIDAILASDVSVDTKVGPRASAVVPCAAGGGGRLTAASRRDPALDTPPGVRSGHPRRDDQVALEDHPARPARQYGRGWRLRAATTAARVLSQAGALGPCGGRGSPRRQELHCRHDHPDLQRRAARAREALPEQAQHGAGRGAPPRRGSTARARRTSEASRRRPHASLRPRRS